VAAIFVCGPFVCCIVMGTVFTYLLQMPLQHIKVLKLSALSRNTMLVGEGGYGRYNNRAYPLFYFLALRSAIFSFNSQKLMGR
jgi:hypothetical protein